MHNIIGAYKLHDEAKLPYRATELSACYDLAACLHTSTIKYDHGNGFPIKKDGEIPYIEIYPKDVVLIPTGIVFCLPASHHLKIYSRSGNAWKRKLIVLNQPAIIDSDYTEETYVMLMNLSDDKIKVYHGDRIAQCEVCENDTNSHFVDINDEQFDQFKESTSEKSTRNGGLGHTG